MSSLFPDGITSLLDLPYPLHNAIKFALQFLDFMDLPKDERPDRSIWLDTDKLEEHFQAVEKRRKEKYGGKGDGDSGEGIENQAVKDLIVGA